MNMTTYNGKQTNYKPKYPEHIWLVCVAYESRSGAEVTSRSKPMTYKEAHKRRKEYEALKKGTRVWVEKKVFALE